nr:MAG TPA: hypothetical protein [Caudoviricetes sp.]
MALIEYERDRAVLSALDDNIRRAPSLGVCAECFAALKIEFERVMAERDEAMENGENVRRKHR